MQDLLTVLLALAAGGGLLLWVTQASRRRAEEARQAELAPVRQLVFEDVTALGTELQDLDAEMLGHTLDAGANADYQRALDAYEAAKAAGEAITSPDQVEDVTRIIEDGRYAVACVQARVHGEPLPTRRPPCFFDPRHGLSTADVPFTPSGGARREVPACALDAERVLAGAEPDSRQVMVGTRRVPYWQGGRAYQPYAQGYYGGFTPMDWMFMGLFVLPAAGDFMGATGESLGDSDGFDMDFGGFDF